MEASPQGQVAETAAKSIFQQRPAWGPIGEQVFVRSYARRVEGEDRKETWPETVLRTVDGNLGLVGAEFIEPDEREKLLKLLLPFDALPAGRHLSASGVKGRQFLFNCHGAGWDANEPEAHFTFLFDELMQGGGVGANYSDRYLAALPKFTRGVELFVTCSDAHPDYDSFKHLLSLPTSVIDPIGFEVDPQLGYFAIPDTREGWVDSSKHSLQAAWGITGYSKIVIDVSALRKKGSELKMSGGTAPGPLPLVIMLSELAAILKNIGGKKLDTLTAMAIDHRIAKCVVAGGKRRSSRMSVKSWRDVGIFEFIDYKKMDGENWTTNISVEIDDDFIAAFEAGDPRAVKVLEAIVAGKRANGEPGIWNRSLSQQGEREPEEMYCPNPCGEIGLYQWENCFAGDEKLLTKEYGAVRFIDVVGQTVTVQTPQGWKPALISQFGEQAVRRVTLAPVRRNTGAEGYQKTRSTYRVDVVVTPNHRWEKIDGVITTSLDIGDVVPMSAAPFEKNEDYKKGVQHGIIFGDGSADRQYTDGAWRHRARLFGAKAEEMSKFFDHLTFPESANGAPEAWLKCEKNLKELPTGSEGADYLSGFITGWAMADGTDKENGATHLGSSHPQAETWLKENAAAAGWVLRAAKDSGTTETNYGKRKNPLMFFTLCRPDAEGLAWQVVAIENLNETVPVYCASVPGVERFTLASGISTCNCNLGHINLQHFAGKPLKHAVEAFRLMTRWLIRATFGDIPQPRQRAVVDKNRRIGVGFFGFHGWLALSGIRYSDCWKDEFVQKALLMFREAVDAETTKYADAIGIPRPVKTTTVAPTGSVALMPGVTTGLQPVFSPWFKRRVRYADTDDQLAIDKAKGCPVYPDEDATATQIVEYWCEDALVSIVRGRGMDPAHLVEAQDDIEFTDYLEVQAMVQDIYANNAISFTINIPESKMPNEATMVKALGKVLYRLKGTTVFPDKSRKNSPYERITKEEFEAYTGPKEISQTEDVCKGGCPTDQVAIT
jgi:ribonucleotide reductase alpha subunit